MPRAARRPRRSGTTLGALALVVAGSLSGCGGIGQPKPYDSPGINGLVVPTPSPDPADFVDTVDNPWLPLEPGATWHYDVTAGGSSVGSIDAEVLDATSEVAGLEATAVRTVTDLEDDQSDVEETRFYAQDADGNVWLMGLDSSTDATWRAGEGGAEAGLAMPADPRLGDGWLRYRVADEGADDGADEREESATIEDQSPQMVQTLDSGTSEAGTRTRNVYEKGVGLVSVEHLDDGWVALLDQRG